MAVHIAWAVEFLLESLGAWLAFRRRPAILFVLLFFRAASDIITFAIRSAFGYYAYIWADWTHYAVLYALLVFMAVHIVGKLVDEAKATIVGLWAAILTIVGTAAVTYFYSSGTTLFERLLDAEITANCFLAMILALGWISSKSRLKGPYPWMAAGLLTLIGSDAVITALWTFWGGARYLYPLGRVPALMFWIWAAVKAFEIDRGEVRVPLGVIAEPSKVLVAEDKVHLWN